VYRVRIGVLFVTYAYEASCFLTNGLLVSIYVAILERRLAVNLPKDVTEAAVSAGLPPSSVDAVLGAITNGTAAAMDAIPGINANIKEAVGDAVKTAYSSSFSTVYLVSIAFGGAAILASIFTKDIDQYMTNYVSRRINGVVATEVPVKEKQVDALDA